VFLRPPKADASSRWRRAGPWVAIVAFLVAPFVIGLNGMQRATATARVEGAAIWIYTPHVAPGAKVQAKIAVYGGAAIALEGVLVLAGETELARKRFSGKTWSSTLRIRWTSTSNASGSEELELTIPKSARPDEPLDAVARLLVIRAIREGDGFVNEEAEIDVPVRLLPRSEGAGFLARLLSGGQALAALLAITALWRWQLGNVIGLLRRIPPGAGRELSYLGRFVALSTLASLGYLGYALFALPLVAATDVTSTAFVLTAIFAWLVMPPVLARFLEGPAREPLEISLTPIVKTGDVALAEPDGYRDAKPAPARRRFATLDGLSAALGLLGCKVRRFGKRLHVSTRAREPVEITASSPSELTLEGLEVLAADVSAAISVAYALVKILGPLRMTIDGTAVDIDGSASRADVEQRFRRGDDARAERMLARVHGVALPRTQS
jgi:hypothetical protein